jgi:hypothetical protein
MNVSATRKRRTEPRWLYDSLLHQRPIQKGRGVDEKDTFHPKMAAHAYMYWKESYD